MPDSMVPFPQACLVVGKYCFEPGGYLVTVKDDTIPIGYWIISSRLKDEMALDWSMYFGKSQWNKLKVGCEKVGLGFGLGPRLARPYVATSVFLLLFDRLKTFLLSDWFDLSSTFSARFAVCWGSRIYVYTCIVSEIGNLLSYWKWIEFIFVFRLLLKSERIFAFRGATDLSICRLNRILAFDSSQKMALTVFLASFYLYSDVSRTSAETLFSKLSLTRQFDIWIGFWASAHRWMRIFWLPIT
jgi:hypothetical protein